MTFPRLARALALAAGAAALSVPAAGMAAAAKAPFAAPRVAPNTAMQKLPDWNGVYAIQGGLIFDQSTAFEPPDPSAEDGGLDFGPRPGSYEKPPFKPETQKAYEVFVKRMLNEGVTDDDVGDCKRPHGFPRIMGGPGPMELFMLPDQVRISFDWFNETRRIYTDGRPHLTGDELTKTYFGHSIGKWEGDTLVVDTVGFLGGLYDQTGAPYSDQGHTVERITMVEPGILEDVMTIDDPVHLTRPWTVTRRYRRVPTNPKMNIGSYCEVNRVEVVNGNQVMQIPK